MDVAITDPLPWYIAGPLLGLFVPAMLLLTGKEPGVSSSFRHACAALLPSGKPDYFRYDWLKSGLWQILFVVGILLGGTLVQFGLGGAGVPLFLPENLTAAGLALLFVGGVLVGFGTRYADGCTSGHTISGISNLSVPSLIASVCFIVGGSAASLVHRFVFGGLVP
ncbi:MAG: YeeE/YedE thiosulfate transporter family protein [Spirochaetales bacterium]